MEQSQPSQIRLWQESSAVAFLDHSKGIAERLWEACIELLLGLIRSLERGETLSPSQQKQIARDYKIFLLWGDGFQRPDGGLDTILQRSKRLRHQTIRILVSMGTILHSAYLANHYSGCEDSHIRQHSFL